MSKLQPNNPPQSITEWREDGLNEVVRIQSGDEVVVFPEVINGRKLYSGQDVLRLMGFSQEEVIQFEDWNVIKEGNI